MNKPLSPALQKLITEFGRKLPDKLAEIRLLHEQAGDGSDATALEGYYTAVHRIAGSSGSYGFRQVSETARVLDRYLSDTLAGENGYAPAHAMQLLQAIEQSLPQD